ncbi:unnamed protein product [Dibothriocephalus latus]|uniref:Uncharacterized protein n=1 Tax=Dibothriocephalus latus TaxID=60516 RepID=A0A3P7QMG1_DIBLA|nr:unnamed protein product [Dibothriocephalus latus]
MQRHRQPAPYQSNVNSNASSPGSFTVVYPDSSPAKSEASPTPGSLHATSKLYSSLLQRPPSSQSSASSTPNFQQSDHFSGAGHSFVITPSGVSCVIAHRQYCSTIRLRSSWLV